MNKLIADRVYANQRLNLVLFVMALTKREARVMKLLYRK